MPRRSTRRTRKSKGGSLRLFSRVYAPVGFVLNSTGKVVKGAANTAGNVVNRGFHGVRKIGNSVARSANKMVRNITRRR